MTAIAARRARAALAASVIALVAFALGSCAKSAEGPAYADFASEAAPRDGAARGADMKLAVAPSQAGAPNQPRPEPHALSAGRKLVYTASMTVETADTQAAVEAAIAAEAAAAAAGGYAAEKRADGDGVWLTLRVPVAALEPLMDAFAGRGRTLSRSLSAQDVTDQFFDLEGRLRNLRLLEERYRAYLAKADRLEEILAVERSLSDTMREIEWLEGSFRDLSKRIELATLSLYFKPESTIDPSQPSLGQAMARLFKGLGQAARVALLLSLGFIIYGVPGLLLAAALWWLCFGGLGLLRRLFGLAARRRGSQAGRRPRGGAAGGEVVAGDPASGDPASGAD